MSEHPHLSLARIGFYNDRRQTEPTKKPDGGCVICGKPYVQDTVRTHSVMYNDSTISLFYRTRRDCHDEMSESEDSALAEAALELGERIEGRS